jgi:hypothetical protein
MRLKMGEGMGSITHYILLYAMCYIAVIVLAASVSAVAWKLWGRR